MALKGPCEGNHRVTLKGSPQPQEDLDYIFFQQEVEREIDRCTGRAGVQVTLEGSPSLAWAPLADLARVGGKPLGHSWVRREQQALPTGRAAVGAGVRTLGFDGQHLRAAASTQWPRQRP